MARPAPRAPKAAPPSDAMDDALLEDEPLLEEGDVPLRNGPRNIADAADDEEIAPPAPVSRTAPAAPARPAPRPAPSAARPALAKPAAAKPAAAAKSASAVRPVAKSGISNRASAVAPAASAPPPSRSAPKPISRRAAPPPELNNDIDDDDDIDFDPNDPEATKEMPAAPAKKKKGSARTSGRRTLSASQRMNIADDEESENDARTSKRSARRSGATSKAVRTGPKIPKWKLIGGGVLLLLILVVAIGYKPYMRSQYTKGLTEGASLDERKSSAEKLYDGFPDGAYGVFGEHLDATDAALREAAIGGMGLVAKTARSENTPEATRREGAAMKLVEAFQGADASTRAWLLAALDPAIEKIVAAAKPDDETPEPVQKIAKALIPLSDPAGGDAAFRRSVVASLAKLRAPGVCVQMIKLATSDGEVKDAARGAIAATALPDAAGELLRAMSSDDKALAESAKRAFVAIRDSAPSEKLLPLVNDPSEDVRREIVDALGKRKNDSVAAQGITRALGDAQADIRILAVKAVPTTGISGAMAQLEPLSKDASAEVRVATAETLAKMRDAESYAVLLSVFKNNLEGATLDAYVKALGARASGKDMKNIGMVIGLLDSNAGSEASLCEALVLLSNNGAGAARDRVRKAWSAAQWKAWYAKINERERMRADANAKIKEAQTHRNADRDTFTKIKQMIEVAMEELEKAQAMCEPDDSEDAKAFDKELKQASVAKDYFIKGASFNLR
jgi:HEAT repeat protein